MRLSPRRPSWPAVLVALTLGLVALSGAMAAQGSPLTTERGQLRTYLDVFDETNLPTWWATTVLLLAALVCLAVAVLSGPGRQRVRWLVLTGVVALLSIDEATVLHERLDRLVLPWLSPAVFPYLWVVPGLLLGAGVVGCVVPLAWTAPPPVRRRLVGGPALLLGSALGGEVVQGWLVTRDLRGWPFVLTYHLEEAGETLGAIVLLAGAAGMLEVRRAATVAVVRLRSGGGEADDRPLGVTAARRSREAAPPLPTPLPER